MCVCNVCVCVCDVCVCNVCVMCVCVCVMCVCVMCVWCVCDVCVMCVCVGHVWVMCVWYVCVLKAPAPEYGITLALGFAGLFEHPLFLSFSPQWDDGGVLSGLSPLHFVEERGVHGEDRVTMGEGLDLRGFMLVAWRTAARLFWMLRWTAPSVHALFSFSFLFLYFKRARTQWRCTIALLSITVCKSYYLLPV